MCKNHKKSKNLHFFFKKLAQMNKKQYFCSEINSIVVK